MQHLMMTKRERNKYVKYMCPYGHIHDTSEECDPCVEKFDLECEWHDPNDGIFLSASGKGNIT